MRRHSAVAFIGSVVALDVLILAGAAILAFWIRDGTRVHSLSRVAELAAVTVAAGALILAALRVFEITNLLDGAREYSLITRACVFGLAAVSFFTFIVDAPLSRESIGLSWPIAGLGLIVVHYVGRRIGRRLRRQGLFVRRALIVGVDANALALAQEMSEGAGLEVVGFLDDYHAPGSVLWRGTRVLGKTSSLREIAKQRDVQDVIIMPQALPWETLQRLLTAAAFAANGVRLHLSAGFYDLLTTGLRFSEWHRIPLLTVNKARLSWKENLVKTALDYVIAVVLLVAMAPMWLVMFAWQRLRGMTPFLERTAVVGKQGREFHLMSLHSTAPFNSSFLRKAPGLINVLRGQMSIVGPRPAKAGEVLSRPAASAGLRPGLTGPWREVDDSAQQSILDLYYIRTYTISLDLQVMHRRALARFHHTRAAVTPALVTETSR